MATSRAGASATRRAGGHGPSGRAGAETPPDTMGICTRYATFMSKGGVYKTMTTILAESALAGPPYKKKVVTLQGESASTMRTFFSIAALLLYPLPT